MHHVITPATLERRSASAFLVAGLLLVASPAHVALEGVLSVPLPDWLVAGLILPGLVASLCGALGLVPRLHAHHPVTTRLGAAAALLGAAVLTGILAVIVVDALLEGAGGRPVPTVPDAVFHLASATLALAFGALGTASLRSGAPSRAVGACLCALALPWVAVLAVEAAGVGFSPGLLLAVYGPIPVLVLATGYALRAARVRAVEDAARDASPT